MTLEEKLIELQSVTPPLSRDEIIAGVEKFKASQPKVGIDRFAEEAAKREGVVEQADATVTPNQTPEASESVDTVSQSNQPSLASLSQQINDFGRKIQSKPVDRTKVINDYLQEQYKSVPKIGEVITANDYEYKYEADVDEEGKLDMQVLYKGPEDEEFVNASEKAKNNPKNIKLQNAEASILSQLGFLPEEIKEQAYAMLQPQQPQQAQPEDFDPNREGTQSFDDVLFYDYATQGSELDRELVESSATMAEIKEQKAQTRLEQVLEESPDARKELEELYAESRVSYENEKAGIQEKIDALPAGNIGKLKEYEKQLVDLEEKYSKTSLLESKSLRVELDKVLVNMKSEIISRSHEAATVKPKEEPSMVNIFGAALRSGGLTGVGKVISKITGDVLDPVDKDLLIQQDFYKKAKEIYANKNGVDVDTVEDEDVYDIVRDMYIQKITEEEKTRLYEDLSKDHVNNWLGGTKSFKDIFGDEEKEQKENLLAAYKDLDLRKEELVNAMGIKSVFNNHMENLDLVNRTYLNEEDAAAARERLRILSLDTKANINIINNSLDSVSEKVKTTADQKLFANLYQRNYGFLTELGGRTSAMALDWLVNGSLEAASRYGVTDLILASNPLSPDPILAKKLGLPTQGRMFTNNITSSVDGLVETINEEMRIPKTFSESWASGDWRDWGSALMTSAGQQIPIYAVLMGTGGAALPLIGLATAGGKFREMQKEIDLGTADYNIFQMYTAATLTGTSAIATEYVTQGMLKRLNFSYKNNFGFKQGFNETIEGYLTGLGRWAKDMGEEVPSEVLDTIVGNFADRYVLKKEGVNLFDGVGETVFSTLWTAGVFVRSPLIGSQLMAPFRSKQSFQVVGENAAKIKELMNELNTNKNLDAEGVNQIKDQINQLSVNSMKALKVEFDRLDKMTDDEKKVLLDNKSKEYEIKRDMKKISENNSYTNDQKKSLLDEKNKQLYSVQTSSANVLAKYVLEENKQKNMPTIEKSIENVQKVTKEILDEDLNVVDDMDKFTEETGQPAFVDAFVDPKTSKIYINKEWAASVGAVTAAEHELLHKIQKSLFDTNPAKAVEVVKDFQKTLSKTELDLVQQRIDENYRYELDSEGNLVLDEKGNKIEKPFEKYAEEYFNIFSDLVGREEIGFTDNLGENLLRFYNKVKNKIFPPSAGFTNLEFKNGRDAYNFIKDYNKNIKKGKVSERASELIKKGTKTTSKESKPSITKRGAEYVGLVKEGILTNEDLVDIINSPSSKPVDKFGAIDAIVENNWPVISNAIKFNPTGSIPIEAVKTAVTEQLQGIFPGRKKELLKDFDAGRNNKVTTVLGPKFLGMRQAEILERAKQIGGTTSEGTSTDSAQAKQIVDTSTTKSKPAVKDSKIAKKPTETTEFSSALLENVSFETKEELEAAISKAIEDAFKGKLITRFGETRDIPKELADIYGELFGINPQTITDKTRNYQNYDAAGLTTAKQFLLKNATQDFSRLPLTKDGFGKGTFLPRNVMKALYTDGVLTGGLKDYIELLRQKPVKPIYRDALGQTIRGLLNLHIRNRMFETLVPTTPQRLQGGAKFSITSTGIKESQKQITNKQATEALFFRGKNQELTMEKVQDLLSGKNWSELTRKEQVSQVVEAIKVLNEELGFNVATSVNLIERGDPNKAGSKKQLYVTSLAATLNNKNISAQRKAEIKKQVENGELIDLSAIKDESKQSLTNSDAARTQTTPTGKNKTKEQSIKSRIDTNLSNIKNITKAKEDVFLNLLKVINKNPSLLGAINSLLYKVNNNAGAFRNLGTLIGMIQQKGYNQNITVGEHVLQYNEMVNLIEVAGITMDPALFKGMSKWLAESYIQVQSTNNTKAGGKKIGSRSGSGIAIQENNYPAGSKNLFTNKNDLAAWNAKVSMLPDLLQQIAEARNGERAWKDVGSPLSKYFSSYGYYNANTFKIGDANGNLVPIANVWGAKVPTKYQSTDSNGNANFPDVVKKQAEILSQTLLNQITIAEGQKQVDAFVSTLAQGKQDASKLSSSLIPEVIKYDRPITVQTAINALEKTDKALELARKLDQPVKKIRVFDFDDTLARTKSNVLYTMPNAEGGFSEGSTKLKAIFMVGGPGAGKTNVGKGLQLGRRGYKVVNQDIALEAMKAESGLPAKESDYTAEQRSTRSKLGAAARKAAVAKFDKYAANGDGMVIDGTGASYKATTKKIKALQEKGYEVHMVVANTPLETALERNRARTERSLPDFVVQKTYDQVQESLAKYKKDFGGRLYEINTEAIQYGKPLPSDFLEVVYEGINANKVGKIDAATFAREAGNMEAEGAQWDFSEFSKVIEGSKGPLLDVAKTIADKRGTKDVFVLTARPADAAGPIKEFLNGIGLNIPLANITGLGDGAPQAKAGWIMGKAAEGYNDFYFADDAYKNVKAVKEVLSQIDVKSKVQLAKFSKTSTFDTIVNDMIEDSSGIETYKKYSAARAKTVGASKGKYAFLIPPSAEDFTGLLYKMIGKGKKGDAQMAFLKTNLLDTYNRAESAVTQAKISAANDFKALKTKLKTLPKTLSKQTGIGKFTYSHAVRVAAWTKQGMDIPGLSKRDIKELNDFVNKDAKLRVFTDELIKIQKGKEYPAPGKDWLGGNITTDIIGSINKVNRAEYQQEWRENIDIIFSEDNMNKMEAAYGTRWREAMEDSIRRMKAGTNRPIGGNRVTEGLLNWLNNSVGAVMFLNTRSALLQTISAVNFINLGDNNIIKAGRAFANQKQFWKDFMTLMNSDYLVERRNGLKINVSESEIADAVRESKNKPKAAIAFLLSKGFVMTRFADSFAIASGGSTFYRNRLEALKKQGLSDADAAQQAFEDFKAIAEENQQSSSPSKISQQQASAAGRVILAWANTPMQYARIQKRAAQDLINGRGDWRSNVSKIVYYGAIQNLIFNSLQQAVFALGFGDDEEETDEAKAKKRNDKAYKIANGMIDSQLKGLGIFGAASAAIKNTLMTLYEEYGKKGSKYENAVDDLLSFSPPLGSKIGKIKGGLRSFSWNMKDMKEKGFSLDNPAYMAGAQVVTGFTNIPLDRVMKKINNLRGLVNERSSLWQKVALGLGWGTWELGLGYYGGFDKQKPLTPKQQLQLEVDTMKKDTSKADQVKTLLDFGLTKKQIRELKNENNRVKKILELQKNKK